MLSKNMLLSSPASIGKVSMMSSNPIKSMSTGEGSQLSAAIEAIDELPKSFGVNAGMGVGAGPVGNDGVAVGAEG